MKRVFEVTIESKEWVDASNIENLVFQFVTKGGQFSRESEERKKADETKVVVKELESLREAGGDG